MAKVLGNLHFFVFLGSPLNFDIGKWYYIYIGQFLKNDLVFDSDVEPCRIVSFLHCHCFANFYFFPLLAYIFSFARSQ